MVFELRPGPDGWKETVLYNFPLPSGACCPYAGVIMDGLGNLYGTAGDPFELSPGSDGWKVTDLHHSACNDNDGCEPFAGLIMDASGNLYGTTEHGGGRCGTVYQLTPTFDGKWQEHILHRFQARRDGAFPGVGALVLDRVGNVYGTTTSGTIFELTPGSGGRWTFTVLYTVTGGSDGTEPGAGLERAW